MNRVMFIGQLAAPAELKKTASGQAMLTFRLATNQSWKNDKGEWESTAEYHNITAWRETAERAGSMIQKGMRVYVEGKLHTRSWIADNGKKQYSVEVVAHTILPIVPSTKKEQEEMNPEEVEIVVE